MGYNRVILMGRLTKDPELKTTQSGLSFCKFSIAVDRYTKPGEDKKADFFNVQAWRGTADLVAKYFTKGSMIHIEGDLQNNNWTDNDGVKHYDIAVNAQNVAFCGGKNEGSNNTSNAQNASQNASQSNAGAYAQPNRNAQPSNDFEDVLADGEPPF